MCLSIITSSCNDRKKGIPIDLIHLTDHAMLLCRVVLWCALNTTSGERLLQQLSCFSLQNYMPAFSSLQSINVGEISLEVEL